MKININTVRISYPNKWPERLQTVPENRISKLLPLYKSKGYHQTQEWKEDF
jgi:hypothetical protein